MSKTYSLKFSALAAASLALLGTWTTNADALSLGKLTINSTLGEPLRAEIALPDITPAELDTLKADTAAPNVFKKAGLEYNGTIAAMRISVERKPDGTAVLLLTSTRPVNDPFIDLILEANSVSGKIQRDYTFLLDPPATERKAVTVTAPQIKRPAQATPVASPPAQVAIAPKAAVTNTEEEEIIEEDKEVVGALENAKTPASHRTSPSSADQVTVKRGDTAGKIAAANKPQHISLDQMLIALLQANPNAFIKGNVNRLKEGTVLEIPDGSQAEAVSATEARKLIIAQSKDFNQYRSRLAQNIAQTEQSGTGRDASGRVKTVDNVPSPAPVSPDKLSVTNPKAQAEVARAKAEADIARQKEEAAAAARTAELKKNLEEMERLTAQADAEKIAADKLAAEKLAAEQQKKMEAEAQAKTSEQVPPTPSPAPIDVVAMVTPPAPPPPPPPPVEKPKPKPAAKPIEPPPEETGLFSDPMVLAGGGGVIALIVALVLFLRRRRSKQTDDVDNSFLDSHLQTDSFFGVSGSQRPSASSPTSSLSSMSAAGASSMLYSPSQLEAAGDVDPVGEAELYLAYGRDMQAEEILKEALRITPTRVAVHVKLLEIYAKRRDIAAFTALATESARLTQNSGPDWNHIAALGHDLDASNPLFRNTDSVQKIATAPAEVESVPAPQAQIEPIAPAPEADSASMDLDLDLDLGASVPPQYSEAQDSNRDLDFLAGNETQRDSIPGKILPAEEPESDAPNSRMVDFDMADLSLDLPTQKAKLEALPEATAASTDNPLATKLSLAEEFEAIGDIDGARTLIQEVIAESSGELKQKAEKLLARLD